MKYEVTEIAMRILRGLGWLIAAAALVALAVTWPRGRFDSDMTGPIGAIISLGFGVSLVMSASVVLLLIDIHEALAEANLDRREHARRAK